jgi:hypothetical protein
MRRSPALLWLASASLMGRKPCAMPYSTRAVLRSQMRVPTRGPRTLAWQTPLRSTQVRMPGAATAPSAFCNAVDATGNVLFTDSSGRVFRIPSANAATDRADLEWEREDAVRP